MEISSVNNSERSENDRQESPKSQQPQPPQQISIIVENIKKSFIVLKEESNIITFRSILVSFSCIYFLALICVFTYLLFPLQYPPKRGLKNNWVFLLEAFLNLTGVIVVYSFWGNFYLKKTWWSPIIASMLVTVSVVAVILEYAFPIPFLALIGAVISAIAYPIIFSLRAKIAGVANDREFQVSKKRFFIVRITASSVVLFSWCYLILFLAVPNLQELFSIFFAFVIFVFKYGLVLFTHRTLPKQYNGLGAFSVELFHSMFILFSFPSVNGWLPIVFVVGIQIFSTIITYFSLNNKIWGVFSGIFFSKNKISPLRTSISEDLLTQSNNSEDTNISNNSPLQNSPSTQSLASSSSPLRISEITPSENFHSPNRDFLIGVITANSLSLTAQFLAPLYYIPIAYFIRYSYNKAYFPYEHLTQDNFNLTIIFSIFSLALAFGSFVFMFFLIKKLYRINLFIELVLPVIIRQKYFLAAVALSSLSGAVITIQYHYQLYYYFVTL
eukprot:TRINITY_DN5719_c0_g1_i1.p1 TRINITY_DN5719_c0_g1~~TRINITY_DN5719_c0_g1_i1.p1  ORF type:complete len:499 (+),score=63.99 TRINITY_DN5719_c0_g1_i1:137-1633(+)